MLAVVIVIFTACTFEATRGIVPVPWVVEPADARDGKASDVTQASKTAQLRSVHLMFFILSPHPRCRLRAKKIITTTTRTSTIAPTIAATVVPVPELAFAFAAAGEPTTAAHMLI